jgi:cell division protein FtsB
MPQGLDSELNSRRDGVQPLRRARVAPAPAPARRRRIVNAILAFAAVVLMVDALVGDRGFLDTLRARRQYRGVAASLDSLRRDNARLREEIRRLNEDPSAIEAIARQDLGLIRPGEVVFIIKDVKPIR